MSLLLREADGGETYFVSAAGGEEPNRGDLGDTWRRGATRYRSVGFGTVV